MDYLGYESERVGVPTSNYATIGSSTERENINVEYQSNWNQKQSQIES